MDTLAQLRAGRLAGARRLDLSCGLAEFPREIFSLADSLEVLNLSGNALASLPGDLGRLHRLRVLFCSDNRFTELPASIGQCHALEMLGFKANRIRTVPAAALPPSLRWLILTDNAIEELPQALGRCTGLQKLMLAGNRLQRLPEALADCRQLALLRIAANRFDSLPDWLPLLPRLAWLAAAGNPWNEARETAAVRAQAIPAIDWPALRLGPQVGEGASGVIHQAWWQPADAAPPREVAVKLFKGAVTSDGWPRSEMAACLAADAHPNLIGALGRIEGHPEGSDGLVLQWVDARFRNLAGPPSLDSCTRDVYPADARWPLARALRLACGTARAVRQLHARGILHGDLYAHNLLWNEEGDALLGDFGAASLLPASDARQAQTLQRIEVRAFGYLLEELLERSEHAANAEQRAALQALSQLQARCMHEMPAERPPFDEIVPALAAIAGAAHSDDAA